MCINAGLNPGRSHQQRGKMYLVIKEYKRLDEYFIPCKMKDGTWKDALDIIESVLDDRWCENEEKIDGIELSIRFAKELSEDVIINDQ